MKQIIFIVIALIIGNIISQFLLDNIFEKILLDTGVNLKYGQNLLNALVYVIIPFVIGSIVETSVIVFLKDKVK